MVDDADLGLLNLDVYSTKAGLWNPDHGDVDLPEGWEFLAAGDAFVTRTVKAAGVYWVAWRPRARNRPHRRRLGLWAPKTAIEAAEARAAETEQERARRRAHGAAARGRQEVRYRDELAAAIREFLGFAPEYAGLADEIAGGATAQAAAVGSGRVGRTRTLSVNERAALAARAFIRHRHTGYEDALDDVAFTEGWDDEFLYHQVKAEAQMAVDAFLEQHRPPAV